jgi:hypothetical protein
MDSIGPVMVVIVAIRAILLLLQQRTIPDKAVQTRGSQSDVRLLAAVRHALIHCHVDIGDALEIRIRNRG